MIWCSGAMQDDLLMTQVFGLYDSGNCGVRRCMQMTVCALLADVLCGRLIALSWLICGVPYVAMSDVDD